MKKIKIGIIIALVLSFSYGITAAKPAPQEIDKVVFIHYPVPQGQGAYWFPAKAPAPTDQNTKYKYSGIHWASSSLPVEYLINTPSDLPGAGDAVVASFQTWEDEPNSGMNFEYQGATSISGSVLDYGNVVSWGNITEDYPGAIAVTVVWYYRGIKEIVDVDTIMNSGDPWAVNAGVVDPDAETGNAGYYDVQNIMTHEAGHWLMLGDLYQWDTQKLTMYGYGALGELRKRTLGAGDKLGIDRIY